MIPETVSLSQRDIRILERQITDEIKEDSNLLLLRVSGVFANFRIEKFPECVDCETGGKDDN